MSAPVKTSTRKRHQLAYAYFFNLHEVKRLRYDDAVKQTADHCCYSIATLEDILRKLRAESE